MIGLDPEPRRSGNHSSGMCPSVEQIHTMRRTGWAAAARAARGAQPVRRMVCICSTLGHMPEL
ncbi:MAG: hypothetical protein EBR86_17350, partial [Planctomycetia bacterium]|nr:hypothetical protein [Planctomycetia bacterium]